MIITAVYLHPKKSELRLSTGINPTRSIFEICNNENLWQWSWLDLRLNAFSWLTTPSNNFISSNSNLMEINIKSVFRDFEISVIKSRRHPLPPKNHQFYLRSISAMIYLYFTYESKVQHHKFFHFSLKVLVLVLMALLRFILDLLVG